MKINILLASLLFAIPGLAADKIACGPNSTNCTLVDNAGNKWNASIAFTTDGSGDIYTLGDVASTDNIIGVNSSSNRTLIDNTGRRWRAAVFYTTDGAGNVIPIAGGGGGGTVTAVSGTAPIISSGGTTPAISIPKATSSVDGYLSHGDWSTFNGKQSSLSFGNLTDPGTDGITVTNGTGAVIGSGTSFAQHVADASDNGYLSSADWTTFNGKQAALGYTPLNKAGDTLTGTILSSIAADTPVLQIPDGSGGGYTFQLQYGSGGQFGIYDTQGAYVLSFNNNLSTASLFGALSIGQNGTLGSISGLYFGGDYTTGFLHSTGVIQLQSGGTLVDTFNASGIITTGAFTGNTAAIGSSGQFAVDSSGNVSTSGTVNLPSQPQSMALAYIDASYNLTDNGTPTYVPASGQIQAFSNFVFSGQPSDGDYICIDSTNFDGAGYGSCPSGNGFTFNTVASACVSSGPSQILIGANVAATIANAVQCINAQIPTAQFVGSSSGSILIGTMGSGYPGTAGNGVYQISATSAAITLTHTQGSNPYYPTGGVDGGQSILTLGGFLALPPQPVSITPTCGAPQQGYVAMTSTGLLCSCISSAWVNVGTGLSCTF
jgi:hypothetical protein